MRLENWIKNTNAKLLYTAASGNKYDLNLPKNHKPRVGDIYMTDKGEQWIYLKDHNLRKVTQPGCTIIPEIMLDKVSSEEEKLQHARNIIYN